MQPLPTDYHLRGIKVAMDAADVRHGNAPPQSVALVQDSRDAILPMRLPFRYEWHVLVQDAQLISHRVLTFGGNFSSMQLVNRFCDPTRQRHAIWSREARVGRLPRHFALEPHLKFGNHSNRLRYGNTVGAVRL